MSFDWLVELLGEMVAVIGSAMSVSSRKNPAGILFRFLDNAILV
jgi:hypothetical protein